MAVTMDNTMVDDNLIDEIVVEEDGVANTSVVIRCCGRDQHHGSKRGQGCAG